ncbi:MAG: hypothetical protein H6828_11245 [Planctomycetes bacterium]|nr:hypothetical protein [Planctomycetota bacterium]
MLTLASLAPALPADGLAPPDWMGIGLVLAIVGSFLLANSILFRHPRQLVVERFGRVTQELRKIREYIFHRSQVNVGFGFLLTGFALQLYGHYRPLPVEAERSFPALWIGIVVVLAVVLLLGSWWWSLLAFRRYVREYFREHPANFEADLQLAREVGELFGLASHADDTVESFVARLRLVVCDPGPMTVQRPALAIVGDADEELEEGIA